METERRGARLRALGLLLVALSAALSLGALSLAASALAAEPAKAPQRPARAGELGPELAGLRTDKSQTFLRSDGLYETRVYTAPVNHRDSRGDWKPNDNALRRGAGGRLENGAAGYRFSAPASLGDGRVRVSDGAAWVEFALTGAGGTAAPAGNAVRYRDALPGVDVLYSAGNAGVKEELVLASAQASSSFSFSLDASAGLRPKLQSDGGIDLLDGDGHAKLQIAPPSMRDAAGVGSRKVAYDLKPAGSGWTLDVTADRGWLASPERKFPVSVDPTVYPARVEDCTIEAGTYTDQNFCGLAENDVANSNYQARSLLKFNLDGLFPADSVVLGGYLTMKQFAWHNSNAPTFTVHRALKPWTSAVTWRSWATGQAWQSLGGDFDATPAGRQRVATSAGSSTDWEITDLVASWADKTQPNQGLLVKEDPAVPNDLAFYSGEDPSGRGPFLTIIQEPRTGIMRHYRYESQQLSDRAGVQTNVANGNLIVSGQDLRLAGTGIDFAVSRFYNGLATDPGRYDERGRDVGNRWNLSTGTDVSLFLDTEGLVYFHGPSGEKLTFRRQADGSYKAPTGLNATLTASADRLDWKLKLNQAQQTYEFRSGCAEACKAELRTQTDQNNNKLTFNWTTASGERRVSSVLDTQGRTTSFSYDGSARVTQITDPAARTVKYGYDSAGNLSSVTDQAGKITRYAYAANGNLNLITTPAGRVTKVAYDAQQRVSSITRVVDGSAGNDVTTGFGYGTATLCDVGTANSVVTDPRGNKTTYCSDIKNQVLKTFDAKGKATTGSYTSTGNVERYTAASNQTLGFNSSFTYDQTSDSITGISQDTGTGTSLKTSFAYDAAPTDGSQPYKPYYPKATTNPQGRTTAFDYDTRGNLTAARSELTAQNQATLGPYDAKGNPQKSIDPDGSTTQYSYNAQGNLIKITPPTVSSGTQPGPTLVGYDSVTRVADVTDGKNQKRTYAYDALDRETKITFADGSSTTTSFDDDGNLLSRTDTTAGIGGSSKTTSFEYDKLGRLTKESLPTGLLNVSLANAAIQYTYDKASNLASLTDSGGTVSYTHDAINALDTLTEPGGAVTRFEANTDGARTKTVLPNGITIANNPDPAGRTTTVEATNTSTGAVLRRLTYEYKSPSTGLDTQLRHSVTDQSDNKTTYSYDALDRLVGARTTNASGGLVREYKYELTGSGNRKTQTVQVGSNSPTTTTHAYNQANQLLNAGGSAFSYDANGNQTAAGSTSSTYNAKDQTTAIGPTNLGYLGPNQNELIAEGSDALQDDVLGLSAKSTSAGTTYLTRDDTGQLVSQRTPNGKRYALTDALGSLTANLAESSPSVTADYDYDPYGAALNSPPDLIGFAGGHRLASSGLYHFGARYYNPSLGRWTQQDPINQADDLRQANRYAYVGNAPVNLLDPEGTSIFSKAKKFGGRALRAVPGVSTAYCLYKAKGQQYDDYTKKGRGYVRSVVGFPYNAAKCQYTIVADAVS